MKRILALTLAALLLAALACPALADEGTGGGGTRWVYTQNGKVLHVRTSMSTADRSNIAGTLPYGAEVIYYGDVGNGWSVINYNGHDHYVMSRFLSKTKPAPYQPGGTPEPAAVPATSKDATTVAQMNNLVTSARYVTPYSVTVRPVRASGWVYLRWFPSKNAALLATCGANYQLTVIAELTDWYQVQDPATGKIGFVYKSYVQ